MKALFAVLALTLACRDAPAPPANASRDVDQVIAADLMGRGVDEVVTWADSSLTWSGGSQVISGRMISHSVGPSDGSGERVAMVFGRSKADPKALPTAWVLDRSGIQKVDIEASRFSDVEVVADGIILTIAERDKQTRSVLVSPRGTTELVSGIMGLKARRLSDGAGVAMGRLYGDRPRSDGGLEIHVAGEAPRTIPTVRGVRTLGTGDVDGDGHIDLVFADGWHFRYAKQGEARLAVLPGPAFESPIRVGEIADSYAIDAVEVVSPGQILAVGTSTVVMFEQTSLGWSQRTLAARAKGGIPVVWRSQGRWFGIGPSAWLVFGREGSPPIELPQN